jgi:hypothetical protein
VRAFVAFSDEATARAAAELLEKEGLRCQLRTSAGSGWTVTAINQLIPTPGAITRFREQVEEVARSLDGSYRGWDAPVVY